MKNAWPLQTRACILSGHEGRETAAVSNLVLSGVRRIPVVKPAFATLYLMLRSGLGRAVHPMCSRARLWNHTTTSCKSECGCDPVLEPTNLCCNTN